MAQNVEILITLYILSSESAEYTYIFIVNNLQANKIAVTATKTLMVDLKELLKHLPNTHGEWVSAERKLLF